MAPPRDSSAAAVQVPKELVEQLVKLSAEERALVLRAANSREPSRKLPTLSWERLEEADGVVAFGGDAVEDCNALYDS
ncbi:MAG: hypothetical protein JW940_35955 [Polyangiaceae bacterium]|nr:hypothetical protein [Polyangiaceae bacterium]